jgi:hypothetical protein
MVNVISKRCIHENCNKRPTFNNFGKTTAEYCFSHKLENMVDVINKKCIHENCNKQPAFNNYGETIAEYCFIHKLENMVNVKSKDVFMKIVINYLLSIWQKQLLIIVLRINWKIWLM